MDFTIEPKITKEFLLSKFSEETFMEFYLGIPVAKKLYRSPLRLDSTPTCSFYRNKSGELIFKDFSGAFYGNFISVVMFKYNCTYHNALKIIANDFGLIKNINLQKNKGKINTKAPVFKDEGTSIIQIEIQNFTEADLKWWNSYGITENILKKYKVFSAKTVFLNGNILAVNAQHNPIYGYYGGKQEEIELWRVYFPKRKSYRFISNWDSKKIQGIKQLPKKGKLLVITKSLKDVMTLYSLGVNAIAPNSETLFIPDTLLSKLKERFENIIVLYDNDLAGISNMKKIKKKYNMRCMWIPRSYEAKDISDYHKKYGRRKTLELIKEAVIWVSRQKKLLLKK